MFPLLLALLACPKTTAPEPLAQATPASQQGEAASVPGFLALGAYDESAEGLVESPAGVAAVRPAGTLPMAGELATDVPFVGLGASGTLPLAWAGEQTFAYGCDAIPTAFDTLSGTPSGDELLWVVPASAQQGLSAARPEALEASEDERRWQVGDLKMQLTRTSPTAATLTVGAWSQPYELEPMDGADPELSLDYPIHVPVPSLVLLRDGQPVRVALSIAGYEGDSWVTLRPEGTNWVEEDAFGQYRCAF